MCMGRTLPSITQLVFAQIVDLKPFYDALRRSDQLVLDQFFEAILQHRPAIGNAANLLPMEILPFAILLEEHKRLSRMYDELLNLIERYWKHLKDLTCANKLHNSIEELVASAEYFLSQQNNRASNLRLSFSKIL